MSQRRWWLELLELAYPPRCAVCDTLAQGVICADCREQLKFLEPPYCPVCGQTAPPGLPPGAPCGPCRGGGSRFDGARAVGSHMGLLREAVLALKFRGRRELLDPLAEFLAQRIAAEAQRPDPLPLTQVRALVPVVLHPVRRRWRGFDQAVLLCRRVARQTGLGCFEDLLIRVRNTQPQIGLTPTQRQDNMAGAFAVRHPYRARGGTLLLVDDVFTTGATMNSAARALQEAGAERVYVLTLTRSVPLWVLAPGELGDEVDAHYAAQAHGGP